MSAAALSDTAAAVHLFTAIDAALQPSGMLPDLSRIIAEFARPTAQWVADPRFVADAHGTGIATTPYDWQKDSHFPWVFTDVPIGEMCAPATVPSWAAGAVGADGKALSSLRVWTIRIDRAVARVYSGIAKPTGAADATALHTPSARMILTRITAAVL